MNKPAILILISAETNHICLKNSLVLIFNSISVYSAKIHYFPCFLLDFGDLDKSFSLGNAHASMALRSLNHDFIVHEALVLVLTFIILVKLFNRLMP